MLGARRLAANAALGLAAFFSVGSTAFADDGGQARARLEAVPVFYVADAAGRPAKESSSGGPAFYLTRSQASLGLGMLTGERAAAGEDADFHVAVTDLAAASAHPGSERFIKPVSTLDAAANLNGVPLFLVRDKEGSPFTLKDKDGHRRVFFYLSESDARSFIDRVMSETKRDWDDIRLSVIPLDVIIDTMQTSKDPAVANWVIYPSAETRLDAAALQAEASLTVKRQTP
jgi:hypothetical protein